MGKRVMFPTVTISLMLAVSVGVHLFLRQRSAERILPGNALASRETPEWGTAGPVPTAVRREWDLQGAIANRDLDAVRRLLEDGADPNERGYRGWTPLHMVAALGDAVAVELLLNQGADIAARNDRGFTTLHVAAPCPEVVEVLLRHGADVNARANNGWTPLHQHSLRSRDTVVLKALLGAGAAVNVVDGHGDTPLLLAVRENENEGLGSIVETLIEAGADVNAPDGEGNTPLSIAAERNLSGVVDLLRAHGAPSEGEKPVER